MISCLGWIGNRLYCFVRGHRMVPDRIYDPMAKSVTPGYACKRCGKTQRLLYRWQSVEKERKDGTGDSGA